MPSTQLAIADLFRHNWIMGDTHLPPYFARVGSLHTPTNYRVKPRF